MFRWKRRSKTSSKPRIIESTSVPGDKVSTDENVTDKIGKELDKAEDKEKYKIDEGVDAVK